MLYRIKLHKRVVKFIESRTTKEKQRIKEKFLQLQHNPYPSNPQTDTKSMQNSNYGYRLRIGNYRFLYDVFEDELLIYIEKADNRGDIYKNWKQSMIKLHKRYAGVA